MLGLIMISCQENIEKKTIDREIKEYSLKPIDSSEKKIENIQNSDYVFKPKTKENNLSQRLKALCNKEQTFQFRLNDDTALICKEGTKIIIPYDIFEFENGDSIPQNSLINVKVEEYYKISEMILNNLTTTSDGQLLETGGMIKVTATVQNKNLKIKNGKFYTVVMNNQTNQKNMQLFKGKTQENKMNWTPSSINYTSRSGPFNGLNFTHAYIIKVEDLRKRIKYPKDAFKANKTGTVYIRGIIDKEGILRNPVILQSASDLFNKEIIIALTNYKGFKPAIARGQPICSYTSIAVNFLKAGIWSKIQINAPQKEDIHHQDNNDFFVDWRNVKKKDTLVLCPECDKINNFNQFDISVGSYNFPIQDLGWINCDRFLREKNLQLTKMIVHAPKNDEDRYFLVFKKIKSIMPDYIDGKSIFFPNVPINYDAILIAIKEQNKQLLFAKKEIKVSSDFNEKLLYDLVSETKLKEELTKFD
jgi:hypothetical protein